MSSNDFWTGYMMGSGNLMENGLDLIFNILKCIFYLFPFVIVSYEFGKFIYDINLVKWGFALVLGLSLTRFVYLKVDLLIDLIVKKLRFQALLILFLLITISYLIGFLTLYISSMLPFFQETSIINNALNLYISLASGLYDFLMSN